MKKLYDDFCEFVFHRVDDMEFTDDTPKGIMCYELYKAGFLDGLRLMNSRIQ